MKKRTLWVMAAILTLCGSIMFTACSKDDDKTNDDMNLSQKIVGQWVTADRDGLPMPTNEKWVITINSPTKASICASLNERPEVGSYWFEREDVDISISGNTMTLTINADDNTKLVQEYNVTSISDTEFTANLKMTLSVNGKSSMSTSMTIRMAKIPHDYANDILGLWECTDLSGIETYNDANARLEFSMDGTYVYWRKDTDGEWKAVKTREFQDYFVDGTLLATRWKNAGESELREWWEIASLGEEEMVWKALRLDENGAMVEQEMRWKRINLGVETKILGKWISSEYDGEPMPTNRKKVYTFVSPTEAYFSLSLDNVPGAQGSKVWVDHIDAELDIEDPLVTLTKHFSEHITVVENLFVSHINAYDLTADHYVSIQQDGKVLQSYSGIATLVKVAQDYTADLLGLWECTGLTRGETYNDANARLAFYSDGTYQYWRLNNAAEWEAVTSREFQNYLADGPLLCTRWKNQGEAELREWWEIESINNTLMTWNALRQKDDGTTFEQVMTWKRIQ